jgi:hypothetical protein
MVSMRRIVHPSAGSVRLPDQGFVMTAMSRISDHHKGLTGDRSAPEDRCAAIYLKLRD